MKAIQQIHQRVINQVEGLTGKSILDYGCGRGDMIELLLQKQNDFQLIFGVDSSEEFVESVKNRFENVVSKGRLVKDYSEATKIKLPDGFANPVWVVELLKTLGAIKSSSDAKRLLQDGAVSIDGEVVKEFKAEVAWKAGSVVKVGKHRIYKIS